MKNDWYLLFDLDGTLSDPLEGIGKSINYALAAFGYPCEPENDLARFIGPPLDRTFAELAGTEDRDHIMALVEKFRERFGDKGVKENKLYPGICNVLEMLQEKGVSMAVCTSKREDFAKRIIDMFGLAPFFDFVSGGDVGMGKGEQIRGLLDAGRITRRAVMIGDRDSDIRAGHDNGLAAFGVLWGYGSRAELEAVNPEGLFTRPEEMIILAET